MELRDILERAGQTLEDIWEGVTSGTAPAALAAAVAAPAAFVDSYAGKAGAAGQAKPGSRMLMANTFFEWHRPNLDISLWPELAQRFTARLQRLPDVQMNRPFPEDGLAVIWNETVIELKAQHPGEQVSPRLYRTVDRLRERLAGLTPDQQRRLIQHLPVAWADNAPRSDYEIELGLRAAMQQVLLDAVGLEQKAREIISSAEAMGISTPRILPLVEEARAVGIDPVFELPRSMAAAEYVGLGNNEFRRAIEHHQLDGGQFLESLRFFHERLGPCCYEQQGREIWKRFESNLTSDILEVDRALFRGDFELALGTSIEEWLREQPAWKPKPGWGPRPGEKIPAEHVTKHYQWGKVGTRRARGIMIAAGEAGIPMERIPGIWVANMMEKHPQPPEDIIAHFKMIHHKPETSSQERRVSTSRRASARPSAERPLAASPGVNYDADRVAADALRVASAKPTTAPLADVKAADKTIVTRRGQGTLERR